MPTSTRLGLRSPNPGEAPDGPGAISNLITDIETALGAYKTDPSGLTFRWSGTTWQEWEGPWQGYGPNFSGILFGTGFSASARWRWEAGNVHIEGSLSIGDGGSVNAQPRMSVPVSRPGNTTEPKGIIRAIDTGTQDYSAVARWLDLNTIGWNLIASGGATFPMGATSPFTFGPTDVLSWDLVYSAR